MPEYRPQTPQEAIDALRELSGKGILIRCGGSASTRGVHPGPTQATMDISGLNKITRLEPKDLTCGVQAGVLLEDLEEALAPHGLALESGPFLPPWMPAEASSGVEAKKRSLGGLLAEDPPASRSFDRGRLRSQLIGIRAVDGKGRCFKAGGRVVKNVAGYDLCKLFVGSGGAYFLGLEFQLRLIALPARIALLRSPSLSLSEGMAKWRELRATLPTPRALDLVFLGSSCRIEVLLGGGPGYVQSQIRHTGFQVALEGMDAWKGFQEAEGEHPNQGTLGGLFRGHCPPSQLASWVGKAPLHGRVHYQGAFEWDRIPEGGLPQEAFIHAVQGGGKQVPGNQPTDPGTCRIAMELKRTFAGGLMPKRLSFLTKVTSDATAKGGSQ